MQAAFKSDLTDGELRDRVEALTQLAHPCQLCPRQCLMDRHSRAGYCLQPSGLRIAAACPHFGEEPAISGRGGAGTVFLAGCNMRCVFCQNHQISQRDPLKEWNITPASLALRFRALQDEGCHNIEWVSPTQYLPALVEALRLARAAGLRLPIVYNTNSYERVEVLRLLDGIVDIYLPDAKYGETIPANKFSSTPDYVPISQQAILEMWRQQGPILLDDHQIAMRGVAIRHLVLPGLSQNTRSVLGWIRSAIGPEAWISLMAQYQPMHRVTEETAHFAPLGRPLDQTEYDEAIQILFETGLENGWVQELRSRECFLPDFDRERPFSNPTGPSEDLR